jgi:hypothetical protein
MSARAAEVEPHQVSVSAIAADGRGIGRTTGRMCVRLPVRAVVVADMVALLRVGSCGALRAPAAADAAAAAAGLLDAHRVGVGDVQQ